LGRLNTLDEIHNWRLNDKLMYHEKMRVGTGVSLQNGFLSIQEKLGNIKTPFILFHGEKDTACDLKGSKLLFEKANTKDKEFKIYKNANHELPWEPQKDEFYADIENYLKKRL